MSIGCYKLKSLLQAYSKVVGSLNQMADSNKNHYARLSNIAQTVCEAGGVYQSNPLGL